MRRNCFFAVVLFLAFGFNASAESFSFTLNGPSDSGNGTILASPTATPGEFLVTGMTGTFDGSAITGVLAPGVYSPAFPIESDNLLSYPSTDGQVDLNGLTFSTAAGLDVDLFYASVGGPVTTSGPYYLIAKNPGPGGVDELTSFSATPTSPTPEPSSVVLLGSGLLCLAAVARRQMHSK